MKLTISRDALLKPLTLVAGAVEKRHTLPILSNILFVVKGQELFITGTDLEVELKGRIALVGDAVPGAMAVPARKLLDITRALPEGSMMEFVHDNQRLTLLSDRARFSLPTLPANEFPNMEDLPASVEFSLKSADLQLLFEQTHFAMAVQDVRFYLNGALMEMDGHTLRVVATDAHRLAISQSISLPQAVSAGQFIIPRKGVAEIMRLFQNKEEELNVSFTTNSLKIQASDYTLTSKLIDGRYPEYSKVIPRNNKCFLLVSKSAFQQALACIAIFTHDKFRGVRLQIRPNLLRILAKTPEHEEAEQEVIVDQQDGQDVDIGFNVSYLSDALAAVQGEQVRIAYSDSDNGVIMEAAESVGGKYIIMPMRL